MIPKRLVQFFFGPLDEDSSKKGVRQGDLVQARNCQMLHSGEHIKRGGFTQEIPTYEGKASIAPEFLVNPDSSVKLTNDSLDDVIYAKSSASGEWKSRGGQQRLTVRSKLRFPSAVTGEQTAPMIKQAGNWFVWMEDESHFRYAQQDADGTRLVRMSDSIAVAGPTAGSAGSTHVKSFAVMLDATFDAAHLWVYWVDWSTNTPQQNRDGVWGMKIPINWTAPTQVAVNTGTGSNLFILTSISATSISGQVYLAQCGINLSTGAAVDFRSSSFGAGDGWAQHFSVDNAGALVGVLHSYSRASTARSWVASGICWLTSTTYTYAAGHMYYAFWSKHATDRTLADLVLVDVTTSTGATTGHTIESVDLDAAALPALLTVNHTFIGQVTGREYSGGVRLVASVRVSAANTGTETWTDINTAIKADRVFTRCYTFTHSGSVIATSWTARGAWLAHGVWAGTDGNECIITGFHDGDETQLSYHLRAILTGAIICQFSVGEAAYAGGCGESYGQLDLHVSDIQQPYLVTRPFTASYPGLVIPTTSASVTGSCDMSAISVSRPDYQQPAIARGLAFLPGGVLAVAGGWQDVQETAPLAYPSSLQAFWGKGSS